MTKNPRAIPGRWFAGGFAILLILGVVIGFSVVVRFQKIMTALDEVRRLWPKAAVVLEDRYRKVDLLIEKSEATIDTSQPIDPKEWRKVRADFSASTLYEVQARLIPELESRARKVFDQTESGSAESGSAESGSAESGSKLTTTDASIEAFDKADQVLEALQTDLVGWLCMRLLGLNVPDRIYSFLE